MATDRAFRKTEDTLTTGRLESLVNYQTMVMSLTSMDIANASLLDEATAAAEGMVMAFMASGQKKRTFFVDSGVLPQTIAVLRTRAKGFGIRLLVGGADSIFNHESLRSDLCGALVQYPDTSGSIKDFAALADSVHVAGGLLVCATDLLALTVLKPPGEWGADIVLGNSARFGVPAGYGGPHAAFFAVTEKLKRKMPGRLIGRSRDALGNPAYRLALQSKDTSISVSHASVNDFCSARAAHPSRKGNQQHLHESGAPCQHGSDVRRLSRPSWSQAHRGKSTRIHASRESIHREIRFQSNKHTVLRHSHRRRNRRSKERRCRACSRSASRDKLPSRRCPTCRNDTGRKCLCGRASGHNQRFRFGFFVSTSHPVQPYRLK
jgi:hypothetical protein